MYADSKEENMQVCSQMHHNCLHMSEFLFQKSRHQFLIIPHLQNVLLSNCNWQFTYDWSSITIQPKKIAWVRITWRWNSPRVQGGLLEGRRVLGSSGNGNAGDNDVESNEAHVGSCEEEARNLITRNLNWLLSWKWELRLQCPCLLLAPQHYQ